MNEMNCNKKVLSQPSSPVYLKVGSYDLLGTIGKGNFSVVKLAQNRLTNQRFALKCIEKRNLDSSHLARIYREIEIMKLLDQHEHIIKLFQVMESKSMLYLVCEYASNGEIFEYIYKNGPMNEKLACEKFCQILSAVEYCHLKNIVHRDLKSENLLLDANMNIKLADFGFANYYDYTRTLKTFCGSPPYAAPEIFQGKKYFGPEIDIWSLGVILYVLVSASLPFDSENLQHIKQKVIANKFRVPYFMSSECEDLINNILVVNSSKRFKMQQIKQHKWIKLNNSSYFYLVNNCTGDLFSTDMNDSIHKKEQHVRIKSKSLKLVGSRIKQNFKGNSAISSLSLPLYSFEGNNVKNQEALVPNQSKPLANENPTKFTNDILKIDLNQSVNYKIVSSFAQNIRRFSELISHSSSVDEGVESDWSSSISSDIMPLASSNSIQSFYMNTTQATIKKSQPSSLVFNKTQKFRPKLAKNLKNTSEVSSFDLKEIKQELNCLQKSILSMKSSMNEQKKLNLKEVKLSSLTNTDNNSDKAECTKKLPVQMQESSLQKFKQLLFISNSKKKSISNFHDLKNKLFLKQKSSSVDQDLSADDSKKTNMNHSLRVSSFKIESFRKYSK